MSDATVVSSAIGFAATVASNGTALPEPSQRGASTLPRSTVLPRVEIVGQEPRLVVEGRQRYEHVRRLGEGGLGEVRCAKDNDIGREIAVKRLRPEARTTAALARFAEEVRTVGALEHPNIIPIHDVGLDENGDYFFVMKYVDGETLESIIDKAAAGDPLARGHYTIERRVQIFRGILDAVAYAHSKGIVHRDIKPANVMVGPFGEVVLMDWGIAKRMKGGAAAPEVAHEHHAHTARGPLFATQVGELVGTPAYMSPEQARGQAVDERSDVYSLCVLFYELIYLRHPLADERTLEGMIASIVSGPLPELVPNRGWPEQGVPAEIGWYIRKGLAKDPAERYANVSEMLERLDRRAEGYVPVQCPITFTKRLTAGLTHFLDRHPFMSVAVLGLGMLGFLAVFALAIVRIAAG